MNVMRNQLEKLEAAKAVYLWYFGYLWLPLVGFGGCLWLPLLTFCYLCLPLFTFSHLSLPFPTFPYLSLPFPYLSFPFPTFPYLSLAGNLFWKCGASQNNTCATLLLKSEKSTKPLIKYIILLFIKQEYKVNNT